MVKEAFHSVLKVNLPFLSLFRPPSANHVQVYSLSNSFQVSHCRTAEIPSHSSEETSLPRFDEEVYRSWWIQGSSDRS